MNDNEIFTNTKILLRELKHYSSDYLTKLASDEQVAFITQWKKLSSNEETLSLGELLSKINEIIYGFPKLREQFLGGTTLFEIEQVRFNPNIPGEPQSLTPDSVVVLSNDIKDIVFELQLTYGLIQARQKNEFDERS